MGNKQAPIDFVIIWVDGNDPRWLEQKNHYIAELPQADRLNHCQVDLDISRYREWENLKYWFRSVEKYAPWVRTVHFVTCGQIPQWLNTDCPKLNIVKHADYIPQEYLPTFSSHPIELNIHRIPGLSEHFVYFNDDCFLTAPVTPRDFFRKGLPCDSVTEDPIQLPGKDFWNNIRINDTMFIDRHFNRNQVKKQLWKKFYPICSPRDLVKNLMMNTLQKDHFFGIAIHHLPQAYRKQVLKQVWDLEPELLDQTCRHRFRDRRDVSQYSIKYFQLLTGQFTPVDMRKMGRAFIGNWDYKAAARCILEKSQKMICINDCPGVDFLPAKNAVNQAFQQVLREKSQFEK